MDFGGNGVKENPRYPAKEEVGISDGRIGDGNG